MPWHQIRVNWYKARKKQKHCGFMHAASLQRATKQVSQQCNTVVYQEKEALLRISLGMHGYNKAAE